MFWGFRVYGLSYHNKEGTIVNIIGFLYTQNRPETI